MRSTTDPKIERLRQVALFAGLHDRDLWRVGRLVYETRFPAGTVIVEQGRLGAEVFVIVAGTASVVRDGRKLARLGSGAVFGELALLDQQPRSATVVAETNLEVLVLSDPEFDRLLAEVPPVGRRLLRELSNRLRTTDAALTAANGAPIPTRT